MKLIPFILLFLFNFRVPLATASDLTFAIAADAGKKNANFLMTRDSILAHEVQKVILPGDNLYNSTYGEVWSEWSKVGLKFEIVALGNHTESYKSEIKFFKMPGEYFARQLENRVRFIVLNSDNELNIAKQMEFLEKDLSGLDEPFVFLVYHHPTYTLSGFHEWTIRKDFQLAIRPLLKRFRPKITALLVGHDHVALAAEFDDLPVILSGAAQDPRPDQPVNNIQDGTKVHTRWFYDGKATWAKLIIPESGRLSSVSFIRSSDNSVRCTVDLVTGLPMRLRKDCE